MKIINTIKSSKLVDGLKKYDAINCFEGIKEEDLKDVEVYIGMLTPEQLKKAEKLKLYQHSMAGSDSYKKEMFNPSCVACNASGTFGVAIAEYTIGAIIYLLRNFKLCTLNQKEHIWNRKPSVGSIAGSTMLIIGLGNIGEEVAKRAKAFGANVIAIRRHKNDKPEYVDKCGDLNDLNEYLKEADIVVSCLPQSANTRKILKKEQFDLMKEGSILVNVGRGSVLELDDLYDALISNHLAGACLDVFEVEPLDSNHKIWDLDNLLITPHSSGNLDLKVSRDLFADIALHNVETLINGGDYINEIDFETGYRKYTK